MPTPPHYRPAKPRTWFTADTHFGHANIIKHCARPFADAGEMDRVLIDNWNATVRPGDEVYHLGDFCMGGPEAAAVYRKQLNGRIHLIAGNHDRDSVVGMPGWATSRTFAEVTVEGQRLVLFHYGMRTWRGIRRGAIHLYGHSHGRLPGSRQSCDVGVDVPAWGFRPVGLGEVLAHVATLPERACAAVVAGDDE